MQFLELSDLEKKGGEFVWSNQQKWAISVRI